MTELRVDADAMLDDWVKCTVVGGAQFVVGTVSGDAKGRFRDGTTMSTSALVTDDEGIVEGAVVETLNSRYLLGQEATDPDRIRTLIKKISRNMHAIRIRSKED